MSNIKCLEAENRFKLHCVDILVFLLACVRTRMLTAIDIYSRFFTLSLQKMIPIVLQPPVQVPRVLIVASPPCQKQTAGAAREKASEAAQKQRILLPNAKQQRCQRRQ